MRLSRRRFLFSSLLLISCLLRFDINKVDAFTVPDVIRMDQSGNPRLATFVGKTIGLGTRLLTLTRSADTISVKVQALSNRQVLRGNLKSLEISVKKSRGLLLHLDALDVQASELSLGWWPLSIASLPLVILKFRPPILFLSLCYLFYKSKTYQHLTTNNDVDNNAANSKSNPFGSSMFKSIRKRLDGSPCSFDYKMTLTQDNLAQSTLLQFCLKSVLRSLMLNSVMGAAAAAGDTMTLLQNDIKDATSQSANKSAKENRSSFLLKPSNTENDTGARPSISAGISKKSSSTANNSPRQEPKLTKLLEATDFKLLNTSFSKDGRLILDADAITGDKTSRFSYTLRVSPQPVVLDGRHMLAFANPECRFAAGVLIGGPLEKFIPDLWIPVGPGVALPLGSGNQIRNIQLVNGVNPRSEISGRVSFFQKKPLRTGPSGFPSNLLPALPPQDDNTTKRK